MLIFWEHLEARGVWQKQLDEINLLQGLCVRLPPSDQLKHKLGAGAILECLKLDLFTYMIEEAEEEVFCLRDHWQADNCQEPKILQKLG